MMMNPIIKLHSVLLVVIFALICVSCSKDEEYSSPLKGRKLDNLTFDYREDLKILTFEGIDISKFNARSSAPWCITGIKDGRLLVMVLHNNSFENRETTVSVTDPQDGTEVSFKVYQKEKIEILVEGSTYEVSQEGGSIAIEVESNANYQVDIEADWISRDLSSGRRAMQKSIVVLNVAKNNSKNFREGLVILRDVETETKKKITIKQSLVPYLSVDRESFSFDEYGGSFGVTVKSNIEYEVKILDSGVKLENTTTINDTTQYLEFKVLDMPSSTHSRDIHINLEGTIFENSCSIQANQKTGIYITNTVGPLLIGDVCSLSYINNWAQDLTWRSSDESILKVSQDARVSAVGKGTATITVSSADGKYSDNITISTIIDLNSLLSYSWTKSSIKIGSWSETNDGCTLKNNSNYAIKLTKLSIYGDDVLLASTTDQSKLGILSPGEEKNLGITNLRSGIRVLRFVWEYTVLGKSYKFECSHQL